MQANNKISFLGSCRLQSLFNSPFPPRLHSTAEIFFNLSNFQALKTIILKYKDKDIYLNASKPTWSNEYRLLCTISGDCIHQLIKNEVIDFYLHSNDFFDADIFIFEISSLQYIESKGRIGSLFYNKKYKAFANLEENIRTLDQNTLENQFVDIYKIIKKHRKSEKSFKIIIIPICDLYACNKRIVKREIISEMLNKASARLDFLNYCPIWDEMRMLTTIDLNSMMKDKYHYRDTTLQFVNDYLKVYLHSIENKEKSNSLHFYRNCIDDPYSEKLFLFEKLQHISMWDRIQNFCIPINES